MLVVLHRKLPLLLKNPKRLDRKRTQRFIGILDWKDGKQMVTLKKIMFMLERFVMVFHTVKEFIVILKEEGM